MTTTTAPRDTRSPQQLYTDDRKRTGKRLPAEPDAFESFTDATGKERLAARVGDAWILVAPKSIGTNESFETPRPRPMLVLDAFREAVAAQTDLYRLSAQPRFCAHCGIFEGEYSPRTGRPAVMQADHVTPLLDLLAEYLGSRETGSAQAVVMSAPYVDIEAVMFASLAELAATPQARCHRIASDARREAWARWHADNAVLQLLCASCNAEKGPIDDETAFERNFRHAADEAARQRVLALRNGSYDDPHASCDDDISDIELATELEEAHLLAAARERLDAIELEELLDGDIAAWLLALDRGEPA